MRTIKSTILFFHFFYILENRSSKLEGKIPDLTFQCNGFKKIVALTCLFPLTSFKFQEFETYCLNQSLILNMKGEG